MRGWWYLLGQICRKVVNTAAGDVVDKIFVVDGDVVEYRGLPSHTKPRSCALTLGCPPIVAPP